jgi:ribosomal-protein-alanine N-acetyltransferase
MNAPCELRTARLLLRLHKHEDIPALVRLAGAREVAATTLGIPHPYIDEDARKFLAKSADDFRAGRSVSFAICKLPGGELCGGAGLDISETHHRAELGYWIGVPFWRRGYATEAARAWSNLDLQTWDYTGSTRTILQKTRRQAASWRKSACSAKGV